jgi:hypothetical protein
MHNPEIESIHKDYAKLLEFGVKEELLKEMTPKEARELLKGLLYLREMYKMTWGMDDGATYNSS